MVAACSNVLYGQIPETPSSPPEQIEKVPPQTASELYASGEYAKAISQIEIDFANPFETPETDFLLKSRAEMIVGRYDDAMETIQSSLLAYPNSIRLRWQGVSAAKLTNRPTQAKQWTEEIDKLTAESPWRYRRTEHQLVIGEYRLAQGVDAKTVLDKVYYPLKKSEPNSPKVLAAIGHLALKKHDLGFAAESFSKAIALDENDADLHFGLAKATLSSDSKSANAALNRAQELNPNHIASRLINIQYLINQEKYEEAETELKNVLEINEHQAEAWAYRAAIAHLQNNPELETEHRNRALTYWTDNPEVDHLIGKVLSQKYRFGESVKRQRRSLAKDSNFLPAKMQLATDLLRLGNEQEGWKLADELFEADPYSVVAFNLANLRDHLEGFETIKADGFVIRMSKSEAAIYGEHVVDLLRDAKKQLTEKYQVELQTPIFIEIFPDQADFAIRTFGLPGGAGFLGVCFGRVVTMNSPAAQGSSLTSWQSVLWHEFCHVVTLQKTQNKMPRWLSEGISVYEERKKNAAWGQSMNPGYRQLILDGQHTTISELSGAFLSPKSPQHLDLAYFEASLAVEYLNEQFGADAIRNLLDELADGTPINDALRRHTAPIKNLDKGFTDFVMAKSNQFASEFDLSEIELSVANTLEEWKTAAEENPTNRLAQIGLAAAYARESEFETSNQILLDHLKTYKANGGAEPAYKLLASNYGKLKLADKELAALESLVRLDANDVAAFLRIMELSSQNQDWERTISSARGLLAINPLIKSPHSYLAKAAEQLNDDRSLVQALQSLVTMQPLDPADTHYRLAAALERLGDNQKALRHVLIALENAPRYRDAHVLLRRLQQTETAGDSANVELSSPSQQDN